MQIPSGITGNNKGLVGVRVTLMPRARKVDVLMGFERYGDLNRNDLEIHLRNVLVLMGINGTISGESGVFQLADAP